MFICRGGASSDRFAQWLALLACVVHNTNDICIAQQDFSAIQLRALGNCRVGHVIIASYVTVMTVCLVGFYSCNVFDDPCS